jgi:hypothetical protein
MSRQIVDPLGIPRVARQLAVSGTSAHVALSSNCTRLSIMAIGGACRYTWAATIPTASATTDHYIAEGERLDIAVEPGSTIAAIRATGSSATALEITELGY